MSIEIKKGKFIKELKNKLNQKCYGNTSEETVLVRAFKYFDLDNTGLSDTDTFLKTVKKIGITSFDDDEIIEIFSSFDTNKQGVIDYREFVSELFSNKSLSKKQKSAPIEKQEIPAKNEIVVENEEKNILKLNNPEEILNLMKDVLNERGVQGICSIARNFRIIDENNSQTIDFDEFKQVCNMYNFGLDDKQLKMVFGNFDSENIGEIDYDEFIRTLRGEMNEFRQNLVQNVFDKLDIKKSGEISFKELNNKYNAKNHPDVISGKISEEEALKEFIDTFQETYNYLCGTETNNIVTIEEFLEYYENVSMTIDEDDYFEYLLNNVWNLGLDIKYKNEIKKPDIEENAQEEQINEQLKEDLNAKKEQSLIKFINEIRKLGSTSLISLMRLFKLNDINNTKDLEFYEFSKSLHEFETELSDEEISNLFSYFDKDNTGVINYLNFINAIRGPMNQKRILILKEAFKKLDLDKGGQVEIGEIKSQFNAKNDKDVKSGEKTEEEVYTEFVDTFQMNHDNRVGPRNKRVTLDEFIDYYNFISMGIEDDAYFISLIQNSWKLNPYYKYNQNGQNDLTNINLNEISYTHGNIKNKKIRVGAAAAPFGTDMTPNTEDKRPFYYHIEQNENIEKEISPIDIFRTAIKKRGIRGIMAMRRAFMIADENDSKTLSLPEFIKFCHDYRMPITGKEINILFEEFDTNKNGQINYEEFISAFTGDMCERRKRLITILFETFDKNRKGFVDLDDIRNAYNPINHPDVLSGKRTEDEVLAEFLDNLQYHFSLLKSDKEQENNKINFEEFLEFFNYISAGIEDDEYFESVIKGGFNLEDRRPKKKGWKSIV
jgi:Ca2+-binding EF-hand superfamily protein